MKVFVDTSALYALMAPEDLNHHAAVACFEELQSIEGALVSTNYVLLECASLLQRRHGFERAKSFLVKAGAMMDIVWIGAQEHGAAVTRWTQAGQRGLSLVDCTSFAVMDAHGLRRAAAFDAQFAQAGFEVLPRPDRVAERRPTYRTGRARGAHA